MRVLRFQSDGEPQVGILEDDQSIRSVSGDVYSNPSPGDVVANLSDVQLLAPCSPSKILCVGSNYAHAVRARNRPWPDAPVVFLKTSNAIVGPGAEVTRPHGIERFEYEAELTVVIGRTATKVSAADANDYIFGLTCGNDMSVRDWQETDAHWTRAKASDTLCPIGPWIETDSDPSDLSIKARVNGEMHQDGRTNDLIFKVPDIIEYLTRTITLYPGDIIMTGSPLGAGPVADGDVMEVEIESIGVLRNAVRQERGS